MIADNKERQYLRHFTLFFVLAKILVKEGGEVIEKGYCLQQ